MNPGQGNDKPLNQVTGSLTGSFVTLTQPLLGDQHLLTPVTGLLGSLNGGQDNNAGLLSPVTGLLGGLTGDQTEGNGGLLAPVTDLVGGLTGGQTGDNGGLLSPITNLLGGLGGQPGDDAAVQAVLEPTLGNTGSALDNVLGAGLETPLAEVGASLDQAVSPIVTSAGNTTQQLGDSTGLGPVVNEVTGTLGSTLSQLGGLGGEAIPVLGNVLNGVGQTVSSTGGVLTGTTGDSNPVGTVLNQLTGTVNTLTSELSTPIGGNGGQGSASGGLLDPVNHLLGGLLGGLKH